MAVPTISDLLTLDVIYHGAPFVHIAAKPDINFNTLDIVYHGAPFYGLSYITPVAPGGDVDNAIFFGTGF